MDTLFLKLLNTSIAASWLVLAVMVLRLLLKKAPRWVCCILWALVAIRLACPFFPESPFSLVPSAEVLSPSTVRYAQEPAVDSGIPFLNSAINPVLGQMFAPDPIASVNPLHVLTYLAGILWAIGAAILAGFGIFSFLRIRLQVREAVRLGDQAWICDRVSSPFILGVVRPRIYLPSGLDPAYIDYVLAHEQAHLQRRDHWWKPLGFLLLVLHWMNPLMWAAYLLFSRDIEMACDERVIRTCDMAWKKAYSRALVSCSTGQRMILACPLAFGEVGVRKRVKTILHYKKPAFWLLLAALSACILAAFCFLTNPREDTFRIGILVPAHSEQGFYYSEEEISPRQSRIVLFAAGGLGDTQVVLLPAEHSVSDSWGNPGNIPEDPTGGSLYAPTYMTPGMPVKIQARKNAWYRIGVSVDNPTDEDITVYVQARGVTVRIADSVGKESDLVGYAVIPMVMVDDRYYYDTGLESTRTTHPEDPDGEITSTVSGTEIPLENDQSNFGTGYPYLYGEEDTLEICLEGKWMLFEARSGDGSQIRYHDHMYSTGDLSEETLQWLYWYNGLSREEQLAVDYVPSDLAELERQRNSPANGPDVSPEAVETMDAADPAETDAGSPDMPSEALDPDSASAIRDAILQQDASIHPDDYDFACCDFYLLQTVSATPASNAATHRVTFYGWALYQEYAISQEGIQETGGSHIPVAITFDLDQEGYHLAEYWQPRDGSYFVPDIRAKFPPQIADDGIDSQKFILPQKQNCYQQAIQYSDLDTDAIVSALLQAVCSAPGTSSNPQDYLDAHPGDWHELLYYGGYTLSYCLDRFAQGGETDLEGKVMALLCEDLLQTKGKIPLDAATAQTGQFWYETLVAHAGNPLEW